MTVPHTTPTPTPPPATRTLKLVLSIVSLAFGGLILLVGISTLEFPMILIGLALGLPGAWWFLHERKAKSGAPLKRHWGPVSAVSAAALIGGGALLPDTGTTADPAETTVVATSTSRPTLSTTAAPATSSLTLTAEEPVATTDAPVEETPTPEPSPAPAPVVEQPAPAPIMEQPAPAPAPAPAPIVEQPTPAGRVVTPGAFCKNSETGSTAQTATGLTVTCTREAGENRSRWRA